MIFYILTGLAVILLLILYGYSQNFFLKTEYYEILAEDVPSPKRLVLLADLHGNRLGKENETLLQRIDREKPDAVCVAGDMTVKNGKGAADMVSLMGRLAGKYPVYYAPGNHEIRMPQYGDYKEALKKQGVFYLENEWAPLAGGYVIGGLDLPEFWYHKFWRKRRLKPGQLSKLMDMPGDPAFPILLAHNPEYFPQYAAWGARLVLSGHIHGGIARLPFLGGVISPSLRLFPVYDAGLFQEGKSRMVLTRGLGLHHIKLRFFNRPELSVIDMKRENG